MKVMIHSNAPWSPSGYGQQTALLSSMLKTEYDTAISAYYGLRGTTLEWEGMTVYPGGGNLFGNDVIEEHSEHHFAGESGLILTLLDVWTLKAQLVKHLPIASWVPLDHLKLPTVVRDFFINSESIPIAMSKFGKAQLEAENIPAHYVPHGIDTDIFTPMDRAECRSLLGFPEDAFIVGMVAANQGQPSRKSFPEAFMAMADFMKARSDVILYLHTDTNGERNQGVNLKELAEQCGIPEGRVRECDQYLYRSGMLSPKFVARAMNCLSVLLNPSQGEGFGVPIIEAQACGTPVIATNCTAMPEVTGVGWLCEGQRTFTGLGQFQITPDVSEITEHLFASYLQAEVMRDSARDFALKYDYRKVYDEYWCPVLADILDKVRSKQIMALAPA